VPSYGNLLCDSNVDVNLFSVQIIFYVSWIGCKQATVDLQSLTYTFIHRELHLSGTEWTGVIHVVDPFIYSMQVCFFVQKYWVPKIGSTVYVSRRQT
jgi:hypothetical protein